MDYRRVRGFGMIAYLIAGVAILAMLSGLMYKIRESGKESVRLEWAEASRVQREKEAKQAEQAATKLEVKREKAKVIYRTITKEVDKIVERDRVVASTDCFPPEWLSIAQSAIRGEVAPAFRLNQPMPKSAGSDRGDGLVALKMDRGGF